MRRPALPLLSMAICLGLGAQTPVRTALQRELDAVGPDIQKMASTLWDYSELALKEKRSAQLLADLLEREGFTVKRGVAGMPTAFTATYGSGAPSIGILAEYDALPGIGNARVPRKEPRADGVTAGQGCGHHLFGAGSVGAALALKRAMVQSGTKGTLTLFGTPAEETGIGKVYMARDGVFSGLDAALEWHPDMETGVANRANQALCSFTVAFTGQPAHAAADPWNGRSALHAVELFVHGVNLMREHVKPTARLHYVIQSGGEAPNVVPAHTQVWMYARDVDRPSVEAHLAWIRQVAEGAALATRTSAKVSVITGMAEYQFNRPLQEAMQRNVEAVGAPRFGAEEEVFTKALQKNLGLAEAGYATTVNPLVPGVGPLEGGSTDVGEVSHLVPTCGLTVASAGKGLPWHSWATAADMGLPGASKAADVAARVLALTALDLLTKPELLKAAKAEFNRQTGGKPYVSPLSKEQKPPVE
jgi:aminobenzoyl-glutamate utilization protein B